MEPTLNVATVELAKVQVAIERNGPRRLQVFVNTVDSQKSAFARFRVYTSTAGGVKNFLRAGKQLKKLYKYFTMIYSINFLN